MTAVQPIRGWATQGMEFYVLMIKLMSPTFVDYSDPTGGSQASVKRVQRALISPTPASSVQTV